MTTDFYLQNKFDAAKTAFEAGRGGKKFNYYFTSTNVQSETKCKVLIKIILALAFNN